MILPFTTAVIYCKNQYFFNATSVSLNIYSIWWISKARFLLYDYFEVLDAMCRGGPQYVFFVPSHFWFKIVNICVPRINDGPNRPQRVPPLPTVRPSRGEQSEHHRRPTRPRPPIPEPHLIKLHPNNRSPALRRPTGKILIIKDI